jgi:hypothetical protein
MARLLKVMLAGGLLALLATVPLAALWGATFGARAPWGEVGYGWQGAQNGVSSLLFLAVAFPPFLPMVALAGAALGVVVGAIYRAVAVSPEE